MLLLLFFLDQRDLSEEVETLRQQHASLQSGTYINHQKFRRKNFRTNFQIFRTKYYFFFFSHKPRNYKQQKQLEINEEKGKK